MIVSPHAQGTPEWRIDRAGIPTASCFHRILTPRTLKPSAQAEGYMARLVAERILGLPVDDGSESGWMQRGSVLERQAVAYYALVTNQDPVAVGFCYHDSRRFGCSPDRLVGDKGGLEIKCPSAEVHVRYLLTSPEIPAEYVMQIQGNLLATGREWWDFLSFCPDFPPVLLRFQPDVEYQGALSRELEPFCDLVDKAEARIRALMQRAAA